MAQSQAAAKAAALRHLGYTVPERDAGALVFAVAPGSPAAARSGSQTSSPGRRHADSQHLCIRGRAAPDPAGHKVVLDVEPTTITPSGKLVQALRATCPSAWRRGERRPRVDGLPGVTGPSGAFSVWTSRPNRTSRIPSRSPSTPRTSAARPPPGHDARIMDKLSTGDLTGRHVVARPAPSTRRATWATWAASRRRPSPSSGPVRRCSSSARGYSVARSKPRLRCTSTRCRLSTRRCTSAQPRRERSGCGHFGLNETHRRNTSSKRPAVGSAHARRTSAHLVVPAHCRGVATPQLLYRAARLRPPRGPQLLEMVAREFAASSSATPKFTSACERPRSAPPIR